MTAALDLDVIKARAEAATPGPWRWAGNVDNGDPYIASPSGFSDVLGHVPVERTAEDRAVRYIREDMDEADAEAMIYDYLHDRYGEPQRDSYLAFVVDGFYKTARDLAIFEVCPTATDRDDPRVYRADVIGVRHPDAEFIVNARQDVAALIAEVERLRAALALTKALHKPITVVEGHDCNDLEQYGVECRYKLEDPPRDVTICDICGYEGREDAHYPCATVAAIDGTSGGA